jgi:regulation of enolase protein 1 (concanavalin A-like superfamily)
MLQRFCLLSVIIAAVFTTAAVADEDEARPNEVPGWGRVIDPGRDCDVSLDREHDRLKIQVPGTPHVLSAEVPQLPMNAPRVVRRIRGDFTAGVHVLGQLEPGQLKTTHYDPYHGAGLIVWQDPSNYLRLERAVGFIQGRHHPYINYELRAGDRLAVSRGITIEDGPLFLKLRRQDGTFSAWYSLDGFQWVDLGKVYATFAERVEVGVVAVNSSKQTLSAELERLNVEDPQGSMARDYADYDSEEPSRPPSASTESPQVPPRRISVLFDPGSGRKSPVRQPAPITAGRTGFPW